MNSTDAVASAPARFIAARSRLAAFVLARAGAPLLDAREARSFVARLRGLHAIGPLGPREALVIRPCASVHTFRLGFPIDVVFLDERGTILRLKTLHPNRIAGARGSRTVVEMAIGTAARLALEPGQVLTDAEGVPL